MKDSIKREKLKIKKNKIGLKRPNKESKCLIGNDRSKVPKTVRNREKEKESLSELEARRASLAIFKTYTILFIRFKCRGCKMARSERVFIAKNIDVVFVWMKCLVVGIQSGFRSRLVD